MEEAIKCEGMKSDTCNIAGQAQYAAVNHDRAIELFQHAVALQIDNRDAHFNLIYLCNFLAEAKSRSIMQPSLQWVTNQCSTLHSKDRTFFAYVRTFPVMSWLPSPDFSPTLGQLFLCTAH